MPTCGTPSGITAVGCQHVGTICNDLFHRLIFCRLTDRIAAGSREKYTSTPFAGNNKFNFAVHVVIIIYYGLIFTPIKTILFSIVTAV